MNISALFNQQQCGVVLFTLSCPHEGGPASIILTINNNNNHRWLFIVLKAWAGVHIVVSVVSVVRKKFIGQIQLYGNLTYKCSIQKKWQIQLVVKDRMNSISPMNFFRTTDTTDTTIWKPGLRFADKDVRLPEYTTAGHVKSNRQEFKNTFSLMSNCPVLKRILIISACPWRTARWKQVVPFESCNKNVYHFISIFYTRMFRWLG